MNGAKVSRGPRKAKALVSKQEAVGTDFHAAVLNVLAVCSREAVLQGILKKNGRGLSWTESERIARHLSLSCIRDMPEVG